MTGTDTDLRALAAIDPAGPADPTAHERPEAAALLAQVLSDDRRADQPRTAPSLRTPRRRWLPVAATAALALGLALTPNLLQPDAYAGWTDVPAAPSASDAATTESQCRDLWRTALPQDDPQLGLVDTTPMVLVEQRGRLTYTVLSDGTWAMDCLIEINPSLFQPVGSSSGTMHELETEPAPDGVAELTLAVATGSDRDDAVLTLYGRVGTQVSGAVVHVDPIGDIEATVTNGYVAAWAPGLDATATGPEVSIRLLLQDGRQITLTPEQVEAASGV